MEAKALYAIPAVCLAIGLLPAPGTAQDRPLSAIDWLTESVDAQPDPAANEPAVTEGAGVEEITVTALGAPQNDAVGLLPSSVTGLPRGLWGASDSADLAELFERARVGLMPALQDLLLTLLLAELDPPADTDPDQRLFLARVDTLMALGAVEQAQALLERAGADDPASFRRWFDASLLTGTEDAACAAMAQAPDLAPGLPARIFCLARNGDWDAAAVTLETGRVLGELTGAEDAILVRYLDPDLFDGVPALAPPAQPGPLIFRLYEAAAEPIPTTMLPLPFAQSDLRINAGWKAQIEAAERLALSGVLDANRLLGLYTERQPAASGGVWDRVAAVQRLDAALDGTETAALADALVLAWTALGDVSLQPVFAEMFAERLEGRALEGQAGRLAFETGLLSERYEIAALERTPADARERFLQAVARGDLAGAVPHDATAAAVADGFGAAAPPERLAALVASGNLGEAILRAIRLGSDGAQGDLDKLAHAIALFRAVGLEDTARRLALQAMILVEDA